MSVRGIRRCGCEARGLKSFGLGCGRRLNKLGTGHPTDRPSAIVRVIPLATTRIPQGRARKKLKPPERFSLQTEMLALGSRKDRRK